MEEGPFALRKKQRVGFCKEETLLMLRAYRAHPSQWNDVLNDVRANLDVLPEATRQLYRTSSEKQLKDRISSKLNKLVAAGRHIDDAEIRHEVDLVREEERRHVEQARPVMRAPINVQPPPPHNLFENEVADDLLPANPGNVMPVRNELQPGPAQARPADRREEPPRRRRRLSDLIRENHKLYNNFMVNTVPRILEHYGIDLNE